MKKLDYLPSKSQVSELDWQDIWVGFSSGIIAFIASLLANTLDSTTGKTSLDSFLIHAGLGVLIFIILFGMCTIGSRIYYRSVIFRRKKLSKYEVCKIVNEVIATDIQTMMQDICCSHYNPSKNIAVLTNAYRIDAMLEFIATYVQKEYIKSFNSNTNKTGRAYIRITPSLLICIFDSIQYILSKDNTTTEDKETDEYISEYISAILQQVDFVAKKVGIENSSSKEL